MSITIEEFKKDPDVILKKLQNEIIIITDGNKEYILSDINNQKLNSFQRLKGSLKTSKSFEEIKKDKLEEYGVNHESFN